MLAPCAVFDTFYYSGNHDFVTLPGGAQHAGSDCPVGAALAPGDALSWTSDAYDQGSVDPHIVGNGCAAKGTCGLPYSYNSQDKNNGLGGGWQLCFAR